MERSIAPIVESRRRGGDEEYENEKKSAARFISRQSTALRIKLAFVPPDPNEFDMAFRTGRSLAFRATRSMSQPSDGFSRFKVGGTVPSTIACMEKIASTAPAAPANDRLLISSTTLTGYRRDRQTGV